MNMFKIIKGLFLVLMVSVFSIVASVPVYSQSYKEITMSAGETKTLYLPSAITSKNLKSVVFYSCDLVYVQVTSYTKYSVTVKAIKSFSSPVIVRCDYRYFIRNGSFTYEASGFYDYRVTVLGSGGGSGVEPTSIRFSSTAVGIAVGESRQLEPTVLPANAEYTLTWSINDNSVATVSQDGLLIGRSVGAADLKVKADNGVYAMLRVVISQPTPTSVSVSPSSVTIVEGQSKYLTAIVYPSSANQSVTWSSGNPSVASVSGNGKVSAIKAGTAIVTAKTSNGKTASCSVVCKAATPALTIYDSEGINSVPANADVTYERVFYTGWNSMCVPFALTQSILDGFSSGFRIALVVDLEIVGDEYAFSVKDVQSVSAGTPCLIYSPGDIACKFSLSNVSLRGSPDNSSQLKGSYTRMVIGKGLYKLTADGTSIGITKSDDATVAPFRAYIRID